MIIIDDNQKEVRAIRFDRLVDSIAGATRKQYGLDDTIKDVIKNAIVSNLSNVEFTPPDSVGLKTTDAETKIDWHLKRLMLRRNLLGYSYIKEALLLIGQNESALKSITKEIYPTIAKKNKTRSCNVERAIRSAIEHVWLIWDEGMKQEVLGYNREKYEGKPTNGEFLAALYDKIFY